MSGEEDEKELELKDLVEQTLEANGILSKIKAQLRASVFAALDENDRNMVRDDAIPIQEAKFEANVPLSLEQRLREPHR